MLQPLYIPGLKSKGALAPPITMKDLRMMTNSIGILMLLEASAAFASSTLMMYTFKYMVLNNQWALNEDQRGCCCVFSCIRVQSCLFRSLVPIKPMIASSSFLFLVGMVSNLIAMASTVRSILDLLKPFSAARIKSVSLSGTEYGFWVLILPTYAQPDVERSWTLLVEGMS